MPQGGYRERTIQNVVDSDGTVIIYFLELSGGTEQTLLHCIRRKKPYKLIDADETSAVRAATLVASFVKKNSIVTLNVAGPRASKVPTAHAYVYDFVSYFVAQLRVAG